MNSMVIREAVPDDLPRLLAISAGIWDGYDYVPHVAAYWLSGQGGVTLAAVVDGVLMGFARLTTLSQDTCWLEGIRVDQSARGLGLGKALTEAMVTQAKEMGYEHIELSSFIENYESLSIINKKGFNEKASFKYLEWMGRQSTPSEEASQVVFRQLPSATHIEPKVFEDLYERILTSKGLARRQGYFSYDWTFKRFEREDLSALLAIGGLYEISLVQANDSDAEEPKTGLMALSQRFSKGNYETLHWVEHEAFIKPSLGLGIERAIALGQTFNAMLPVEEYAHASAVEGLEALSEANEDVFVFYYK